MNVVTSPVGIAQIVARNIVPLAGILFFHWSAPNVLLLYGFDTLLSMAVIFAGLASTFDKKPRDSAAARVKGEIGYVVAALFVALILALPLGMPVGIALATSDFSWRFAWYDHSLRNGALVQAVIALWSYVDLRRALATATPESLQLKRRFAFIIARWIAVLIACYFLLDLLGGDLSVYVLIVVYIGASIFAEVAPDKFLEVMPGGTDFSKEVPIKSGARHASPPQSDRKA